MSKEEFTAVVKEWFECERRIMQNEGPLSTKARQRQAQIEHDMEKFTIESIEGLEEAVTIIRSVNPIRHGDQFVDYNIKRAN
jgi:hypothetical protein